MTSGEYRMTNNDERALPNMANVRLIAAGIVAVLVEAAALGATVLVPIEFRELVTVSSAIVHGRVVDVRAGWVDGRRAIETLLTIDADEYYKGAGGETLTVRVPGGEIGRFRTVFVGAPEFRAGDEVVLFLRRYGDRVSIVGLSQGAYRVVNDRSGRKVVASPVLMGKGDGSAAAVVRGDAARRPLPVRAFRDLVRRVMADGAAR
jgi:hypothetical protein